MMTSDRLAELEAAMAKLAYEITREYGSTLIKAKRHPSDAHEALPDLSSEASDNSDHSDDDYFDGDLDDEEEDDEDDEVQKASQTYLLTENDHTRRPGQLGFYRHPSAGVGITPATRPAGPHKFDSLVRHVQERDSVTRSQAMITARLEYPDVYQSYQAFVAASPTSEQASRRTIGKSGPLTFDDLVEQEMCKGVNAEVAGQRIMQLHGSAALRRRDTFAKIAADADATFAEAAADFWDADPACTRVEALRKARLAHPQLYKALRNI